MMRTADVFDIRFPIHNNLFILRHARDCTRPRPRKLARTYVYVIHDRLAIANWELWRGKLW